MAAPGHPLGGPPVAVFAPQVNSGAAPAKAGLACTLPDPQLEHIIDLILEVKAQTYSFEAANVQHEHEWRVWPNAKPPPGKMLMPGVVSHVTNLVEHPNLVADLILRYAAIAGRENVIAGTDCGIGGRVHAYLVWAKRRTLAEGARLGSKSLWP